MILTLSQFGLLVKAHREDKKLTQKALAESLKDQGINRTLIAHLEQGRKAPNDFNKLEVLCSNIGIPDSIYSQFKFQKSRDRNEFESILAELVGINSTSLNIDLTSIKVVESKIDSLINSENPEKTYELFNSILVFYGINTVSRGFYDKYLKNSLNTLDRFRIAVWEFIKDAIRLFSSINEAFITMNSRSIVQILEPLKQKDTSIYSERPSWEAIKNIPPEDLPFLGYIAAAKVEEEAKERKEVSDFLLELAEKKKNGTLNLQEYSTQQKNKIESLLIKFESRIKHGIFSTLFDPSIEELKKEAEFISPTQSGDIQRMGETQSIAYENLGNYLTSDFLDVYVATSMRENSDFISVNNFVENLFIHPELKDLKLRYFNPTQSWIEDRIAKGLVEAVMLKRASICIYMAQKKDTFGKDSEASVTLGQGKPVIVMVPKLINRDIGLDSEELGHLNRTELLNILEKIDSSLTDEVSPEVAEIVLLAKIIYEKLNRASDKILIDITKRHWADFDLEGEANSRIKVDEQIKTFKDWLNAIINDNDVDIDDLVRKHLIDILVANAVNYEKRAKIFREVHPLALQVILSSGILNGILVVRSLESCASIIRDIIENNLDVELKIDDTNYRLIEKKTRSTIRVISKHQLLSNTFNTFYKKVIEEKYSI